jgi:hypothetical protein
LFHAGKLRTDCLKSSEPTNWFDGKPYGFGSGNVKLWVTVPVVESLGSVGANAERDAPSACKTFACAV